MAGATIESNADFSDTPSGLATRWAAEIEASKKELKKFWDNAVRINRRYLDQRDDAEFGDAQSRVNLFWSSMQVLLSLLYARPPKASVSRAFQDADDDVARVAGLMLQRLLNGSFDDSVSSWDAAIRQGIEDQLITGMGQAWIRYEVQTEQVPVPQPVDPATGQPMVDPNADPENPAMQERIVSEDAPLDYIFWRDFLWSPARTWPEVRWVARIVHMTRDALNARFGDKIGKAVPLKTSTVAKNSVTGTTETNNDPWAKAEVYEIWCKDTKRVYWWVAGMDTILDMKDDPLKLDGFFPCPKPLIKNLTSTNFMPRADYIMAQDQFEELDEINTRITWLTRAAKVVGVYDKKDDGIKNLLSQAAENQLVPVDNWAMFAEGGGLKGKIDWVPIDQIVNAIDHLRQYRADKVQQIYEVLGISDIMRGSSKASETAAAQQIKAQFGSTRVQLAQFYIAEWITSLLRLKAEVISKHWQPETIAKRSNIQYTPDVQYAQQAVELIKNEEVAEYRISIEADSMAALDWAAERDAAVQFMQALGTFLQQVGPMAEKMPEAGPYLLKLMQWAVSKFRVSTEIEGVLDQAVDGMRKKLMQPPPPPPPDPKLLLQQAKAASDERIAQIEESAKVAIARTEAASNEKIEALKAAVDASTATQQAQFGELFMQFQVLSRAMAGQQQPIIMPQAPPAPPPMGPGMPGQGPPPGSPPGGPQMPPPRPMPPAPPQAAPTPMGGQNAPLPLR